MTSNYYCAALSTRQVPETDQEPNTILLRIVFSEGETSARGPAIFIDRDGVINCRRPGDYVLNWSQFVFVPGMRIALRQIASLGLPMIVISNQAAVGKGLLDLVGLREITTRMQQALLEDGTILTAAYYCPHRSEEQCSCRKPKPGLLFAAARDFDIDLTCSIFIGDSIADVEAARGAGTGFLLYCDDPDAFRSHLWAAAIDVAVVRKSAELFDQVLQRLPASVPIQNRQMKLLRRVII